MNRIYKIAKRYGKGNRARTCAAAFLAALALTGVMGMSEAQASTVTGDDGQIGGVVINHGIYYKNTSLRDGSLFVGDNQRHFSQISPESAKLGNVKIDKEGKITGVAAGAVTAGSTDAVNGSQLHAVATEAAKHSKVVNGSNINVQEAEVNGQKIYKVGLNDDVLLGKLTGNNVSLSGTNGTIEATGSIATKDHIIADKGAQLGKVTISEDGKITGVAAGAVTAGSTDAVNGSQLHAVATEAAKHSKVVNGSNINVQEAEVNGQKIYKVGLNDDVLLGKLTGNNVSLSGTNGTIEATGSIATKDHIIADKGAQLGKVTISEDGKITGVAAGAVTADSKDAVNGGQLYATNQLVKDNASNISLLGNSIDKLDNRVDKVGAGAAALAALHPLDFDPEDKWDFAAGYGNYSGASAVALGAYYRPNEDTMFSVGGSFGNGENMVNAGVSLKLGQSNRAPASKAAMEKKISALSQEVEELKAAIADLRAAQTKAKDAQKK